MAKIEPVKLKGLERAVSSKAVTQPSATELPMDAGPADEWIAQNPTFAETEPTIDAPVVETPAEEVETPEVETPTEETPAEETPAVETPETPAVEAPVVEATTETPDVKPAEAKPAETPKTFAAEEKFALADGNEWTRAQIIEGLQRAHEFEPLATEAHGFQKLFAGKYEDVAKNWGPILDRLSKEPTTLAFLDKYLADRTTAAVAERFASFASNPEKVAYLEQCAAHYDEVKPPVATPAAATAPAASLPTEAQRQLNDLQAFKDKVERDQAVEKVNREMADAIAKYPFLGTDANVRNDLLMTAQALNAQDPSKGIPEALALKASIYDALRIARTQKVTPVPAAVIPALPTASGATPTTTSTAAPRPKKFEDTVDAVEDWYNNPPSQFR